MVGETLRLKAFVWASTQRYYLFIGITSHLLNRVNKAAVISLLFFSQNFRILVMYYDFLATWALGDGG